MRAWICETCLWIVSHALISGTYSDEQALRFLVVGDWGGKQHYPYVTHTQMSLARQMAHVASTSGSDFVVSVGDNFYPHGVTSVHDMRFEKTFEQVFSDASLQTTWFVIAGNHDHEGNVSAQIDYTRRSFRWYFPDYYYNITLNIPGSGKTVTFVMMDTIVLCGLSDVFYMGEEPSGPADYIKALQQMQWLENVLAHDRSDYLLVVGHYPIWSTGYHGPSGCLRSRLRPLLHKYHVNAYFAGHEHNMQHMKDTTDDWSIDYFIIGAGAMKNARKDHNYGSSKKNTDFFWVDDQSYGAFAYVTVSDESLDLTYISGTGEILYSTTIRPRQLRRYFNLKDIND